MTKETVICSTCGILCSSHFHMCDLVEGRWCCECFAQPVTNNDDQHHHNEDCETVVNEFNS